MPIETQNIMALLQELLLVLRANDADRSLIGFISGFRSLEVL